MTDITTGRTLAAMPTVAARLGTAAFDIADDGSSYRVVRLFGAPQERLFRAVTDPADLRRWFVAGAPDGSLLTECRSDPVEGGEYHFVMEMPEHGEFTWQGRYTLVDRPGRLEADEWFLMGEQEVSGEPSRQTLTFEATGDGGTVMTMEVVLPASEDPETLREQTAGGLGSSLDAIDAIVSG